MSRKKKLQKQIKGYVRARQLEYVRVAAHAAGYEAGRARGVAEGRRARSDELTRFLALKPDEHRIHLAPPSDGDPILRVAVPAPESERYRIMSSPMAALEVSQRVVSFQATRKQVTIAADAYHGAKLDGQVYLTWLEWECVGVGPGSKLGTFR
jgi:hypothetical protein